MKPRFGGVFAFLRGIVEYIDLMVNNPIAFMGVLTGLFLIVAWRLFKSVSDINQTLSSQISDLNKRVVDLTAENLANQQKYQDTIHAANDQIQSLKQDIRNAHEQIEKLHRQVLELNQAHVESKKRAHDIQIEFDAFRDRTNQKIVHLQEQLEVERKKAAELQRLYELSERQRQEIKDELALKQNQIKYQNDVIRAKEAEVEQLTSDNKKLAEKIDLLVNKIDDLTRRIETYEKLYLESLEKIAELGSRVDGIVADKNGVTDDKTA